MTEEKKIDGLYRLKNFIGYLLQHHLTGEQIDAALRDAAGDSFRPKFKYESHESSVTSAIRSLAVTGEGIANETYRLHAVELQEELFKTRSSKSQMSARFEGARRAILELKRDAARIVSICDQYEQEGQ